MTSLRQLALDGARAGRRRRVRCRARRFRAGGQLVDAVLQAVERLLDALQPRAHGAQPARQPVDVGGRRQVERAHRRLLRVDRLLACRERPRDRAVDQRVLEQVGGELAERLLALARQPVAQARRHQPSGNSLSNLNVRGRYRRRSRSGLALPRLEVETRPKLSQLRRISARIVTILRLTLQSPTIHRGLRPRRFMTSRHPIAIALAASAFYAGVFVTAAHAEMHYVRVTLVTGQQLTITVDVPPGTPVDQIQIPGLPAPIASIVDLGSVESTPSPTATARADGHHRPGADRHRDAGRQRDARARQQQQLRHRQDARRTSRRPRRARSRRSTRRPTRSPGAPTPSR